MRGKQTRKPVLEGKPRNRAQAISIALKRSMLCTSKLAFRKAVSGYTFRKGTFLPSRFTYLTHCHDTEMNDAETHTDVNNAHDMNSKNANTMMNITAIHVDNDKC